MGWPQITVIVIYSITLLVFAREHGKPRTGKHNFWATLISIGVMIFLLIMGGFFAKP